MALGLKSGTVNLVEYDDHWPQEFHKAAEEIRGVLGQVALRVEHFGSTSVPGCSAKPILDLTVEVSGRFTDIRVFLALRSVGYGLRWTFVLPERACLPKGLPITHHLYVVPERSVTLGGWLKFRDALRADAGLRLRYEMLKQDSVTKHGNNRMAYTAAKSHFVHEVMTMETTR